MKLQTFTIAIICVLSGFCAELHLNAQSSHDIDVSNTQFTPDDLTIDVGDTVIWTNTQGFHNINGTASAYPENPESFGNTTGSDWVFSHVFNTPGVYNYHCDPHKDLGMTGKITVQGVTQIDMLTINFSDMSPHMDQDLWLSVYDSFTGEEIARVHTVVTDEFSINVTGVVPGRTYIVDFYADHNHNGRYDAPSTDHAWRLEADIQEGVNTLNFVHNTTFTDIEWQHKMIIDFSAMNPHVGQNLWLKVIDTETGNTVANVQKTVEVEFSVEIETVEPGNSYQVDFFADHNQNGKYDAPPTDHAWRLSVENLVGDTTLEFVHNTSFTDINWLHQFQVNFMAMNPHVGQNLWLAVIDQETGEEVARIKKTVEVDFTVEVSGVMPGNSYWVDFFADHNQNGKYDAPPDDHAWRLSVEELTDGASIGFTHNTDFTDIEWQHKLTIDFKAMNPHVGQNLWLAVFDTGTGKELARKKSVVQVDFSVDIPGVMPGNSYQIDFYADHNENGKYDSPSTDHAWRIAIEEIQGDTVVEFTHNTDFTDIEWMHKLTINFEAMNPHVGQKLTLYLMDLSTENYVDTLVIDEISGPEFSLASYAIESGNSYNVDFFADHNQNGMYDSPPTDHAWRIIISNLVGDSAVTFVHNTDFTDISGDVTSVTSLKNRYFSIYPNPVIDKLFLQNLRQDIANVRQVKIMSISGQRLLQIGGNQLRSSFIDVSWLDSGIYLLLIETGENNEILKFVKN